MKLEDAREIYYFNSGKTSDLVRQLGLAGIAIIWIFKGDAEGVPKIPPALILPLGLILLGLAMDLIQYVLATIFWGAFHRIKEQSGIGEEAEFVAPRQINWTSNVLFYAKVVAICAAYVLLLRHLTFDLG